MNISHYPNPESHTNHKIYSFLFIGTVALCLVLFFVVQMSPSAIAKSAKTIHERFTHRLAMQSSTECNTNGGNACVDLGNLDDESYHNLVGWDALDNDNPFPSPSGDTTLRFQQLNADNMFDLYISAVNIPYILYMETANGACDDSFSVYVNGQGPLYTYNAGSDGNGAIAHEIPLNPSLITGTTVSINLRNLASDGCGKASTHRVWLENTIEADPYEPNNSSANANTISSGQQQQHTISPIGDLDFIKFNLDSESAVRIATSGVFGFDTVLALYDEQLNFITENDDIPNSRYSLIERFCDTDALPAGAYYIRAIDYSNDNELEYALDFQITETCTPSSGPWGLIENFDSFSSNALNGQNGWSSNGAQVVIQPNSSNKAATISDANYANVSLNNNLLGQTTFHACILQTGNVDAFLGLSDNANPSAFSDFETQVGSKTNNDTDLVIRDGTNFRYVSQSFPVDQWRHIWYVINNDADSFQVYTAGSNGNAEVVSVNGQTEFGFRNGTTSALQSILLKSETTVNGGFYVDNLHTATGTNLSVPQSCSFNWNPVSELPDLIIASISISAASLQCEEAPGQLNTYVTIENIGNVAASSFEVSANGTTQSIDGLNAGQAQTLTFSGSGTTATIDPSNAVLESNESNNTWDQPVPIPTPIAACTATPPAPENNSSLIDYTDSPPAVDGNIDVAWQNATSYLIDNVILGSAPSNTDLSATWRGLYDNDHLYLLVEVADNDLSNDSGSSFWQDDSIEVYVDGNNSQGSTYDNIDDLQLMLRWDDPANRVGTSSIAIPAGIQRSTINTSNGYRTELLLPLEDLNISPTNGYEFGIDIQVIDDDDGGDRDHKLAWNAVLDETHVNPGLMGQAQLQNRATTESTDTPTPVLANTPIPVSTDTPTPILTNTPISVSTDTPTPILTNTPISVSTDTPTPILTNTPIPVSTDTPTPIPTNTPIPVSTDTPIPIPTNTPIPVSTDTPTPVPTSFPLDDFETDNDFEAAKLINPSAQQQHSIAPSTDVDFIKFVVTTESSIQIETSGLGGFDTILHLYDEQQDLLEKDDDSGNGAYSLIQRTCGVNALKPGTYYAEVRAYQSNVEFDYTLTYQILEECTPGADSPAPVGSIGGIVWCDFNGNSSIDNGEGLGDVVVTLVDEEANFSRYVTSITGRYLLTNLDAQTYTLVISSLPDNCSETSAEIDDVNDGTAIFELTAGEEKLDIDFQLAPTATGQNITPLFAYLPMVAAAGQPVTSVPLTPTPTAIPFSWEKIGMAQTSIDFVISASSQIFVGSREKGNQTLYYGTDCYSGVLTSIEGNSQVRDIALSSDGRALVSSQKMGVFSVENFAITPLQWNTENVKGSDTQYSSLAVEFDQNGNAYVGTDAQGIFILESGTNEWKLMDGSPTLVNTLTFDALSNILWIGSFGNEDNAGNGIIKLDTVTREFTTMNNGLASPQIRSINDIITTDQGTVYIASDQGIYFGNGSGTWFLVGLRDQDVRSLEIWNDVLYAGTKNGGIHFASFAENNTWKLDRRGLPINGTIRDLHVDRSALCNGLLAATEDGLWVLR